MIYDKRVIYKCVCDTCDIHYETEYLSSTNTCKECAAIEDYKIIKHK